MSNNLYSPEYIERYLAGSLSEEERDAFKVEMENNPALRLEVEESVKMKTAAYYSGGNHWVESKMDELDSLLASDRKKKRRLTIWAAIGGIAAVVILILLVFPFKESTTDSEPFIVYYERPPAIELRNSGENRRLANASILFNQGEFEESLAIMDSLHTQALIPEDRETEVRFYRAICHIELEQYDDAIELLANIQDEEFVYDARWYQALCYLKTVQNDRAAQLLEQLSGSNNPYKSRAREILEKLELRVGEN